MASLQAEKAAIKKERSSVVHVEWLCTGWRRMQMKRGENKKGISASGSMVRG